MSHTISVRLTADLAKWLESTSRRTGMPQSRIIRDQLEHARHQERPFMALAGIITGGPKDLSSREGYSRK